MGILLGSTTFARAAGSIMLRGMKESVGRNWQKTPSTNDKLDVVWVQIVLNMMIRVSAIPTVDSADGITIDGRITTTETYGLPGPTVSAIIALQMFKLKHRKPSGQIKPGDATHLMLSSWKRPVPVEVQFAAIQEATLASPWWDANIRDQNMKAVLEIMTSAEDPDHQYLNRGTVRQYLENQTGATLSPSSLLRDLSEKFEKDTSVGPAEWIKVLRGAHKSIISGIAEMGAPGTTDNVTSPSPWAKTNPALGRKEDVSSWFEKKMRKENSILYPFQKNLAVDSTFGILKTLDEVE